MKTVEDNIVRSPHPLANLPEGGLYKFLDAKLVQFGPSPALIESASGRQLTFSDVRTQVERVSYHLQAQGVTRGDVFALCAQNSATYVILELSLARLGAVFAVINGLSSLDEIKHCLSLAGAKYLFVRESLRDDVSDIIASSAVEVVFVDGDERTLSLMEPIPAGQVAPPVMDIPSGDVCGIQFSSGTSGLPKAVDVPHRGFLAQCMLSGPIEMGPPKGQAAVIYQPMSHVFGSSMTFGTIAIGGYIVIMPRFNLEKYLQLVAKYKVKQMQLVPPVLVMLLKSPLVHEQDLSSVDEIFVAAAPVSAQLEQEVTSKFGEHVCIRQGYGITEVCSVISMVPPRAKQTHPAPSGSVGTLASNLQLKVIDISTGEALGANKNGEIMIRAEHIMTGYRGNPQETKATIDSEGWLHTGDVGYFNEEGYVFVVDRIKELIKYNAYQVPPAELEGLLLTHTGVADVGVIGLPDKQAGELPHAWVVRKPGSCVTEEELVSFVAGLITDGVHLAGITNSVIPWLFADRTAPYKKLRGGVKFVAEIPKNPSGKILHRIMRDRMK